MTKTRKLGVIAVATLLSALSLPRSSSAQQTGQEINGYWAGFETYQTSVYTFSGQLIASYSGEAVPAELEISTSRSPYPVDGTIQIGSVFAFGAIFPADPFGPTSASGGIFLMDGPGGNVSGNFFLTYDSILPDGQIDVGNGVAVADLTTNFFNHPMGETTVSFASFTSVPEPSSIVPAALAVLVFAVVAWMRGFCRRPRARLS
jgi:hypothetical protein